ncbi:MAG: sugar phosphate isomerase/epimerase family protein [Lautropia sp.]
MTPATGAQAWPLSLSHLTVIELSPPEVVEAAAAAGFAYADLRLAKAVPTDTEYPMFGDTPMLRETLRRVEDTGVRVFDVELIRLHGGTDVPSFERLLDAGRRLGAAHVKVSGDDANRDVVVAKFAELCALAAGYGLLVDLEFTPWSGVNSLAAAVAVVEASGAANGRVLIDSLHLMRSGGDPSDLARVDGAHFAYLQLCDAPSAAPASLDAIRHEARNERMVPGEGGLPLAALLSQVPPTTPLSIELPMRALAARVPPAERARLAADGTRRFLASLAPAPIDESPDGTPGRAADATHGAANTSRTA